MVYLTREEVEKLNRGEVPAAQYMKGTLEWDEDYDYYWVPSTGSWVVKEKKGLISISEPGSKGQQVIEKDGIKVIQN